MTTNQKVVFVSRMDSKSGGSYWLCRFGAHLWHYKTSAAALMTLIFQFRLSAARNHIVGMFVFWRRLRGAYAGEPGPDGLLGDGQPTGGQEGAGRDGGAGQGVRGEGIQILQRPL